MKRQLTALVALTLSIGLVSAATEPVRLDTAAASTVAPAQPAALFPALSATVVPTPPVGPDAAAVPTTVPAPDRLCSEINLLDSPEAIAAAGFTVELAAGEVDGGIPDCPGVFSNCQNSLNVVCRATTCSTTDTGERKCRLPDGHLLNCGHNTIHVTSCGNCTKIFQAACCTQFPACLCGTCGNGGNQSISCQ